MQEIKASKLRGILALFLLSGIVVFILYITTLSQSSDSKTDEFSTCDLTKEACEQLIDGHLFHIEVVKPSIRALEPFTVVVQDKTSNGLSLPQYISSVEVMIEGRDMYMGSIQKRLLRQADRWQGDMTIPVCAVDNDMVWRINIMLFKQRQLYKRLIFDVSVNH